MWTGWTRQVERKEMQFTKETLINRGGYVMWAKNGQWDTPYADMKFVARFRGGRGGGGVRSFMTHVIKNWTVEDYFAAMDEGKTPLEIVRATGYLLPHIKRWLKNEGYPQTMAGYKAWCAARRTRGEIIH